MADIIQPLFRGGRVYEIVIGGRRARDGVSPYIIARLGRGFGECQHLGREALLSAREAGADAVRLPVHPSSPLDERVNLELLVREVGIGLIRPLDPTDEPVGGESGALVLIRSDVPAAPSLRDAVIETSARGWRVGVWLEEDASRGACCPSLRAISTLRSSFPDVVIGWALGSGPRVLAVVAYTMGARMLEIPFTLSRSMRGNQGGALEPSELRSLAGDLAAAQAALEEANPIRSTDARAKPPLFLDVTQRG